MYPRGRKPGRRRDLRDRRSHGEPTAIGSSPSWDLRRAPSTPTPRGASRRSPPQEKPQTRHLRAVARRAALSSSCVLREEPCWSWGPSPRRHVPAPPATPGTRGSGRRRRLPPPTSLGRPPQMPARASVWPARSCSRKPLPGERRPPPCALGIGPFLGQIQRPVDEGGALV